ncbi:globin [Kitasatospora sp. MMS16-BH015]|uniref:globin domain-containing protein n=1 Tax=Kitasatospora sp. MMS16-BH015 TaxID=2018025 RepID=UPI000CA1BFED|nr:globin domain-containing protein [Kitasatospora sp. MMS16-BH015]AUG75040.1 globin [Kitasatospora sp. MMS16-BH015]
MTPEHIALVTASAARLRDRLPEIADAFYRRLFAAHPQLRALFTTDQTLLRTKFAEELHAIVQTIPDFPGFVDRTRALGARHAGYHVRAEHYALVREALLTTLAESVAPQDWTEETATAWRLAYDLTAEAMMLGAAKP